MKNSWKMRTNKSKIQSLLSNLPRRNNKEKRKKSKRSQSYSLTRPSALTTRRNSSGVSSLLPVSKPKMRWFFLVCGHMVNSASWLAAKSKRRKSQLHHLLFIWSTQTSDSLETWRWRIFSTESRSLQRAAINALIRASLIGRRACSQKWLPKFSNVSSLDSQFLEFRYQWEYSNLDLSWSECLTPLASFLIFSAWLQKLQID